MIPDFPAYISSSYCTVSGVYVKNTLRPPQPETVSYACAAGCDNNGGAIVDTLLGNAPTADVTVTVGPIQVQVRQSCLSDGKKASFVPICSARTYKLGLSLQVWRVGHVAKLLAYVERVLYWDY